MIEALAHDLGKVAPQRWEGNHAKASAELLEEAGFGDEAVLRLIQRHHKRTQINEDKDLELLQMADRMTSSSRVEGGASTAFTTKEMGHHHLKLVEAYLRFELKKHFVENPYWKYSGDYICFKCFIQNNWWLEAVRASSTDAGNESLRHHLLLTDAIYQRLLLEVPFKVELIAVPQINGRPKDIKLRLQIMELLAEERMHPYAVWKRLEAKGVRKDRRFISRLLVEMLAVGVLERRDDISKQPFHQRYVAKRGFAPKQMTVKVQRMQSKKNERRIIEEMHTAGYRVDAIALELGLTEEEVRVAV